MTADLFWDAVADQGSPMRGRGAEFETVLGLLDGTQQGQGRVLLVEGEPGTGKRCCWPGPTRKQAGVGFAWWPRRPAN